MEHISLQTYIEHISLQTYIEYDAICDKSYAATIGQMYVETSIPYIKVELIHYHILSKKDTV